MNLRAYLDSLPRGQTTVFASRCGISPVYLSQIAAGQDKREASPALCVVIERESSEMVMRWDLRPDDWHLIWPELRKRKDAPRIPVKAEA